jgi:hypothetical protein
MIFFLVKRSDFTRRNFKSVTEPKATVAGWDHTDRLAVAWNEIYTDLDKFKRALLEAAKVDPVCQAMAVVCKKTFKLDPFATDDFYVNRLFSKLLRQWSSPMTGNITNWPHVRPVEVMKQLETNWTGSTSFAPGTLQRIGELVSKGTFAGEDIIGHRDQALFLYNITEAARSLFGGLTSYPSKKLEKIFALRLVLSDKLLARQRALLSAFWDTHGNAFCRKAGQKDKYEYLRYYVQGFDSLSEDARVETMKAIFACTAAKEIDFNAGKVSQGALAEWKRLPPVVACAILLSDIPRVFMDKSVSTDRPRVAFKLFEWQGKYDKVWTVAPQSLPSAQQSQPIFTLNHKLDYVILRDSDFNKHAPSVSVREVNPRLFGWVRNEYAAETITYRTHLCPIWGGSSGHATGRIGAWVELMGNNPQRLPVRLTVASSYVVLWRLYYDKRVSPVHLLVETYEATLAYSSKISAQKTTQLPSIGSSMARHIRHDDAFDLVLECAAAGGQGCQVGLSNADPGVNPLAVWSSIKVEHLNSGSSFSNVIAHLSSQVDSLRDQVVKQDNSHWLPRWSKEKTMAKATAVVSHKHSAAL